MTESPNYEDLSGTLEKLGYIINVVGSDDDPALEAPEDIKEEIDEEIEAFTNDHNSVKTSDNDNPSDGIEEAQDEISIIDVGKEDEGISEVSNNNSDKNVSDETIGSFDSKDLDDSVKDTDRSSTLDPGSKDTQDSSGIIDKIDGHKYYYDSNGDVYRVDDSLMANTTYDLNGYHYTTDDAGRISWVEGDLHLRDRDSRLTIRDDISNIGLGDELETDDRGHIIADLFDGPNGLENLIPQDFSINRGAYNKFEGELADEIRAGNDVRANFEIVYPEGDISYRPSEIIVTYTINDQIYFTSFPNTKNK